jgi:hypothetical protein
VIITCPRCFSADDVSFRRLPDKMVQYHCSARHSSDGEHSWLASMSSVSWTPEGIDGVTDELLDPMFRSVLPDEPFVEYGVVEYRFRLSYPELFAAHVRDRGYVMLAPGQATASSVRFAATLGRLARTSELVSVYGPATGAWSYNSQVTYWARPPAPTGAHISWSAFCSQLGRPDTWMAEDRAVALRG